MLKPDSNFLSLTDAELFRLVQTEDNRKAYEVLYYRYWPKLVDAAYKRLSSQQKAEDLVQEIFISIYQRRTKIELTNSLQSYLNQALKYKILNEFRDANTRQAYVSLFFNDICKNDLANGLEAKEMEGRIESVLSSLPQKCRQVFTLSRKEKKSNKEIAERLNISVSTVEKHIVKALKILRQSVHEYQTS